MHPDFLLSGEEVVYRVFGFPVITRYRDGLSAKQLSEWEAMDRLDPIGEFRADFRMAELASVITNIAIKWSAGKKQVKLTDIMEYMPQWDVDAPKEFEVKKQSVEEMKEVFKRIAESANKHFKKIGNRRPPANLKKKKDGLRDTDSNIGS